jgi:hypothetical protein
MKIITDANLNQPVASRGDKAAHDKLVKDQVQAQEDARVTVIDRSDRVPQFDGQGYGAINAKGPDMKVHSLADEQAISASQTY